MIDTKQHSNVLSDEQNSKNCGLNAEIPIEELELSVRAYNYLKRAELNTLSEIINCMETDFSSFLYQMHSSMAVVNNLLLAIKGLGLSTDRYEKLLCSSDDVAKQERRESGQKTLIAKQTNVPSIGVLIIYLTKVPRYKNIITDEYETIPHQDIVLIDKYFSWGKARYEAKYEGGKYGCDTLEEWCGIPESQLPHKYIVNYYRDFFTEKNSYSEMLGRHQCYTIFEHIARIAKANQIFAWFIKNVMSDTMDMEYHEVSREQIKNLLNVCKQVVGENSVNVELAKELLPLMDKHGYFFGTDSYNEIYAAQVTTMIDVLEEVLKTTDFERETVYFNAAW